MWHFTTQALGRRLRVRDGEHCAFREIAARPNRRNRLTLRKIFIQVFHVLLDLEVLLLSLTTLVPKNQVEFLASSREIELQACRLVSEGQSHIVYFVITLRYAMDPQLSDISAIQIQREDCFRYWTCTENRFDCVPTATSHMMSTYVPHNRDYSTLHSSNTEVSTAPATIATY